MASAGDILMRNFVNDSASNLIEQTKERKRIMTGNGKDVVDAIPTRTGIKKIKHEDDEFLSGDEDVGDEIKPSTIAGSRSVGDSSSSNSEENSEKVKPTCCAVFCSLFSCHYLFKRYTIFDLSLNIGAIGLYIFDFITDWLNAFNAYWFRIDEKGEDYRFYFGLTVAVITMPSIVMQIMSWWWEREDNKEIQNRKKDKAIRKFGVFYYAWFFLSHALQIGPVYRYIRTIYYGLKSRYRELCRNERRWRFYHDKYQGELADVNFVRLLESFLESAPQIVLQIYIMIKTADVLPITVLSVCVSAFGMSSSYVTYQRALRDTLEDKEQLSILACIVLFIYRSLVNLSRVLALALLLNTSVLAWLFGILAHWILMASIIVRHKTQFCTTKSWEYFYDVIIGFCYIFSYINVHADNMNACRMLLYYWLMFLENSIMGLCWYYFRNNGSLMWELTGIGNKDDVVEGVVLSNSTALGLLLAVVGSFCIGMLFLALYYLFFHPKAPLKLCRGSEKEKTETIPKASALLKQFSTTDSSRTEPEECLHAPEPQSHVRKSALRRLYVMQTDDNQTSFVWSV